MNSERQKREDEIEKLVRGAGLNRQRDAAFQEQLRKDAAAMVEKEAIKIAQSERAEQRKRLIRPTTVGLCLVVVGAAVGFSLPSLGWVLMLCGIAAMVWSYFWPSRKL